MRLVEVVMEVEEEGLEDQESWRLASWSPRVETEERREEDTEL